MEAQSVVKLVIRHCVLHHHLVCSCLYGLFILSIKSFTLVLGEGIAFTVFKRFD